MMLSCAGCGHCVVRGMLHLEADLSSLWCALIFVKTERSDLSMTETPCTFTMYINSRVALWENALILTWGFI